MAFKSRKTEFYQEENLMKISTIHCKDLFLELQIFKEEIHAEITM